MKAYAKNLHGRNQRHSGKESDHVPKASGDRIGTKSAKRMADKRVFSTCAHVVCSACGIEGIHACLGKPLEQSDMPDGVLLVQGGELAKKANSAYCEGCGGFVEYDKNFKLMSSPPQYAGTCKECKKVHYAFCTDVN